MHGATLAAAATSGLAEELSHDRTSADALTKGVDMVAVRAYNGVSLLKELDETSGDGFLAIVEVDEAEHLASIVHLGAHILEGAAQNHVLIELQGHFAGYRRDGAEIGLIGEKVRGGNLDWVDTGGEGGG